jgi:hypothetical protein
MDYKEASEKIITFTKALVEENKDDFPQSHFERTLSNCLQIAWADSIRAEWQKVLDANPDMKPMLAAAKEMIKLAGYDEKQFGDPICMPPGMKAMICMVDKVEAVCIDYTMSFATPLSAIYVDKVREALDIADKVKALSEKAEEKPHG